MPRSSRLTGPARARALNEERQAQTGERELWYVGVREDADEDSGRGGETRVYAIHAEGTYPLSLRLDVRNHSPTGFEWGYEGSGPAQLALALLLDAIPQSLADRAVEHYQDFKRAIVGKLPLPGWALRRSEVLRFTVDGRVPEVLSEARAREELAAGPAPRKPVEHEEE